MDLTRTIWKNVNDQAAVIIKSSQKKDFGIWMPS